MKSSHLPSACEDYREELHIGQNGVDRDKLLQGPLEKLRIQVARN